MEVRQFCPQCKSIAIDIKRSIIVGTPSTASCGHCGWSGLAEDADALLTTDHLHGVEELSLKMLNVITAHAAGPLVRVLSEAGLIAKKKAQAADITKKTEAIYELAPSDWEYEDIKAFNEMIDECRGEILKKIFENCVGTAFDAAGEVNARVVAFQPPSKGGPS